MPSDAVTGTESRKLDPDEIPLQPIAHKDGSAITLKCRTPEEAFLVCDELEKADIIPILPDEEELLSQFRRDGYVEVRVSAKAYESLADLRSTVEFQYKQLRSEQQLSYFGKGVILSVSISCLVLWFVPFRGWSIAISITTIVIGVVAGLIWDRRSS